MAPLSYRKLLHTSCKKVHKTYARNRLKLAKSQENFPLAIFIGNLYHFLLFYWSLNQAKSQKIENVRMSCQKILMSEAFSKNPANLESKMQIWQRCSRAMFGSIVE